MAIAEELELKVVADTAQAESKITGLADHVDKKSKSMGEKMGAAGKKMTLGVTLPIVAGLGASVKAFTAQEDATKKLNSAFESTGAASWTSQEALMANADALQIGFKFTFGSAGHVKTDSAFFLRQTLTNDTAPADGFLPCYCTFSSHFKFLCNLFQTTLLSQIRAWEFKVSRRLCKAKR